MNTKPRSNPKSSHNAPCHRPRGLPLGKPRRLWQVDPSSISKMFCRAQVAPSDCGVVRCNPVRTNEHSHLVHQPRLEPSQGTTSNWLSLLLLNLSRMKKTRKRIEKGWISFGKWPRYAVHLPRTLRGRPVALWAFTFFPKETELGVGFDVDRRRPTRVTREWNAPRSIKRLKLEEKCKEHLAPWKNQMNESFTCCESQDIKCLVFIKRKETRIKVKDKKQRLKSVA